MTSDTVPACLSSIRQWPTSRGPRCAPRQTWTSRGRDAPSGTSSAPRRSTPTIAGEYANRIGTLVEDILAPLPYFPDWTANRRVAGALASFYVDPSLVVAGERWGVLVLGLRRGLAEVLNTPGFQPRFF